jgi:uncharacterized protein (UPF0147 family)
MAPSRSGGQFSDWSTKPADSKAVYSNLEQSQHHTSSQLRDCHPYIEETSVFNPEVHKHEVAVAFGDRTMPKLAALLTVEGLSDEDRLDALIFMHKLLSDQEQKSVAIACDVVQMCTDLLKSRSSGVREYAARNLASLSAIMEGRRCVTEAGALKTLVAMLLDSEVLCREASSLALMCFSDFRDGGRDLIDSDDEAMANLVACMFDRRGGSMPSSIVVYQVVSVIADCTSLLEGVAVERVLAAKGVEGLVKLLKPESNSSPKLQVKVLSALWNISMQEYGKSPIIDCGAVPLIVDSIAAAIKGNENSHGDLGEQAPLKATTHDTVIDAQVRRIGSGALNSLSVDEVAKVQLQTSAAVTSVCELLYDPAAPTRSNATSTIHHVCESPSGLVEFTRNLVCDEPKCVEVFAERAAQPLVDLLIDAENDLQMHAATAIMLLTNQPNMLPGDPLGPGQPTGDCLKRSGWSSGVLQCLHVVPRLIDLFNNAESAEMTLDSATTALRNLARQSPRAANLIDSAIADGSLPAIEY